MSFSAGAEATSFGMMKGTFDDGLPMASSTRPNGSFRTSWKVLSSTFFHSLVAAASAWPMLSRLAQRSIDGMTSSEVTGLPSWPFKPPGGGERLPLAVALGPALDGRDDIVGGDGLPVVPLQAVAEREGPGELEVARRQ